MGLQLASASVDGVVKLWNLKKQNCVNTFEMHGDKIWTMDLIERIEKIESSQNEEPSFKSTIHLVTGGCDSTIKLWRDHTTEWESEEKKERLNRILQEQKLS